MRLQLSATVRFEVFAGVYGSEEEGLRRMAADVKYACALWRVGCARPKPCGFARSQGEKRSINVHSQASSWSHIPRCVDTYLLWQH